MNSSEKFCLKWNDFQENIRSTFVSLREDTDFTDVTLACEDGKQVEAHKVILVASSPVFTNLLKKNKHNHPFIYMRGMRYEDLVAIVDFLYSGEASIYQEHLDSFLVTAEELKLQGLSGDTSEKKKEKGLDMNTRKGNFRKYEKPLVLDEHQPFKTDSIVEKFSIKDSLSGVSENTVALNNYKVSGDIQELDQQIKSMMRMSENKMTGSYAGKIVYTCTVCGKEGISSNLIKHIEANHIEGISHPCGFCDKTFRSRPSLRNHKTLYHTNC